MSAIIDASTVVAVPRERTCCRHHVSPFLLSARKRSSVCSSPSLLCLNERLAPVVTSANARRALVNHTMKFAERCTIFVKIAVDLARKKQSKEYPIPMGAKPNTFALQPEICRKTGYTIRAVATRRNVPKPLQSWIGIGRVFVVLVVVPGETQKPLPPRRISLPKSVRFDGQNSRQNRPKNDVLYRRPLTVKHHQKPNER